MYRKIQKLFDLQPTKVLICLKRATLIHSPLLFAFIIIIFYKSSMIYETKFTKYVKVDELEHKNL